MNQADILVIGVIYNTYPETIRYLNSLTPQATVNLAVILVDNSDQAASPDFIKKINGLPFLHYLETGKNLGYFGGAREGLKYYLAEHPIYPSWILVTNVDIVFTPQFFTRLTALNHRQSLGLVAPSIISKKWNTDYNPKIQQRYSKKKLLLYRFLYSSFLVHNLFLLAAYGKKWVGGVRGRNKEAAASQGQLGKKIYAPHGSCLVFKNDYFIGGGTLDMPNFLFGEEVMVAETAMQLGLDVEYHPELVIHDYEHASTGFFLTPKMSGYNRQAIQSILTRYYP